MKFTSEKDNFTSVFRLSTYAYSTLHSNFTTEK